jgi:inorganic pyrophosphatase
MFIASQRYTAWQVARHLVRPQARGIFSATLGHSDVGDEGTMDFRKFYVDKEGATLSPWHDIPMKVDGTDFYNVVIEIPSGTSGKYEIATDEANNPIKIDVKNGAPRQYPFPSLVNYGAAPQTWEDPEHVDETGFAGDNDPVDVCDIGSRVALFGEVYPVKVLGALAMVDEGELDWKIIAVRASDPLAGEVDCVSDGHPLVTRKVDDIREWFRTYKVPDGKPLNAFAYDEAALDAAAAKEVLATTHAAWSRLVDGKKASGVVYGADALAGAKGGLWVR